MCCNIKYVKKYITVKIIKIDLINFERNFIGPSVPIKSKQNHATFGHSWNHNKDLAILCFYRYFSLREVHILLFSKLLCSLKILRSSFSIRHLAVGCRMSEWEGAGGLKPRELLLCKYTRYLYCTILRGEHLSRTRSSTIGTLSK